MREEIAAYKRNLAPAVIIDPVSGYGMILEAGDDDALKEMFGRFSRDPVTGRAASELRAAKELDNVTIGTNLITAVTERFNRGTAATMVMGYGPYVQGAALGVVLYVFPLVLPFVLIPGWGKVLLNYFLTLAWVRSCSLGWVLADRITAIAAFSVANIDASFHDNLTAAGSGHCSTRVLNPVYRDADPALGLCWAWVQGWRVVSWRSGAESECGHQYGLPYRWRSF